MPGLPGSEAVMLFTIGHSTLRFDEFIARLQQHDVTVLVDVRRLPGSRRSPHFNQNHLARELPRHGIDYRWVEDLGGRRRSAHDHDSPNAGLTNASFRAYADYMATPSFQAALDHLTSLGQDRNVAFMCAESVYWRCHRRLISDALLARGVTVQHIMDGGKLRPHSLTPAGCIEHGRVTYPPPLFRSE